MSNRYKGFPYPIERTTQGLFQSGSDINQIKASMLTIIMTKPGERVFFPQFGTPLHKLSHQGDMAVIENGRQMIASSLKVWEKRVQVTDVQCRVIHTDAGRDLNITVTFLDPMNMQEVQELKVQMPLEGV